MLSGEFIRILFSLQLPLYCTVAVVCHCCACIMFLLTAYSAVSCHPNPSCVRHGESHLLHWDARPTQRALVHPRSVFGAWLVPKLSYFGPCALPRCFCNVPIAAKVSWASVCQAADLRIFLLLIRAGAFDLGFLLSACHTVVVKITGAWPISTRTNIGIMERWSGTHAAF